VIAPFELSQLGAASIDLTLGDEIRVIEAGPDPIDVVEAADYRRHTVLRRLDQPFVLSPGVTIHGISPASASRCPAICAGCSRGAVASPGSDS
jgi:hypothetical protein